MKYLDEYRDPTLARGLVARIRANTTRPWVIMEVCGGQTHSIVRYGLDRLLPAGVELVHGPGCPVCVTPVETLERAHAIAARPGVIFASFGDMLRVPSPAGDLLSARARGADIRIVYSPLDAVDLARQHNDREVVFFGIGFETTAPANALAVLQASKLGLPNFSMLVSHVLVPPAMQAILEAPENRVQAFLGPGHVCSVMGYAEYEALARDHRCPIVITGFEPLDLLEGIGMCVDQLEAGHARVDNQYVRGVCREGNARARALIDEAFEVTDQKWRGIGCIPRSGLKLREHLAQYDAARRFELSAIGAEEPAACISGLVLRGQKKPNECPAFGRSCTPETPLGATMVSGEGACRAYFQHGRRASTGAPLSEECAK